METWNRKGKPIKIRTLVIIRQAACENLRLSNGTNFSGNATLTGS